MINFVWFQVINQIRQLLGVRQVPIVQEETDSRFMGVFVQVIDTACIKSARPADQAMHFVAFVKQQFREVGTILSCNASNERSLHPQLLPLYCEFS